MRLSELFRPFLRRSLPNNTYWPRYTRYTSRNLVYLVHDLNFCFHYPKFQFQKQLGNFYCDGIRQSWILQWQDRLSLSHLTWECLNLSSSPFIQHFATNGSILVSSFLLHFKSSQLSLSSTYVHKKTCSCPFVRYFCTLFWDDITIIFWWKNCFGPIKRLFSFYWSKTVFFSQLKK